MMLAARWFTAILLTLGGQCAVAQTATSSNYRLPSGVLNAAGGETASVNFRLNGSLGDLVVGSLSSAAFGLADGYSAVLRRNLTPAENLLEVVSRKHHGTAGAFDISVNLSQLPTGNITTESRQIGQGHTLVFRYDAPVRVAGYATITDENGNTAGNVALSYVGNDMIATLTNVPDHKQIHVRVFNRDGTRKAEAALGFLAGDAGNTRAVTAADLAAIKTGGGQMLNQFRARQDVNADGVINAQDIQLAKARAGRSFVFQRGNLGAYCVYPGQCLSGSCADNVCSDGPCKGVCEAADLPGSVGFCTAIPSGHDPDSECRSGLGCNGARTCRCSADHECGGQMWCNGASCTSQKASGQVCTRGVQCLSGICGSGGTCCAGAAPC